LKLYNDFDSFQGTAKRHLLFFPPFTAPPRAPNSRFMMSFQHQPITQSPDGSSGGGGYYRYQCCWWNEQSCGGWVYQNGDACADCQVAAFPGTGANIYLPPIGQRTRQQTLRTSVRSTSAGRIHRLVRRVHCCRRSSTRTNLAEMPDANSNEMSRYHEGARSVHVVAELGRRAKSVLAKPKARRPAFWERVWRESAMAHPERAFRR